MAMPYKLTTVMEGKTITVRCNEPTARILLKKWAEVEPNLTSCFHSPTKRTIEAFVDSEDPGRMCAICGKMGGTGFTTALRLAGVQIPEGQIGYAHADCLHKLRNKLCT